MFRHGAVVEWYRNGPFGLEQGFTLTRRPGGSHGSVIVSLRISGSLTVHKAGSQILFASRRAAAVFRYGGLSVRDAEGRTVPARLVVRDGSTCSELTTGAHAIRYGSIFIQQGGPISVSSSSFGGSVGLSADGDTALIGGVEGNLVWVFSRSGGVRVQQGAPLTGSGAIGGSGFGSSVALSADGNTAIVGSPYQNAAWVFTRSGGEWTQQGPALAGGRGASCCGSFGTSVALSGDGHTAAVGAPYYEGGAVWVFVRSGSTWVHQGTSLTASDETGGAQLGSSVALSSDGNTALVGGPNDNYDPVTSSAVGAAWVFIRSGSSWAQQGPKLIGAGASGNSDFGSSVAMSADGNTALVGGPRDNFQPNVFATGAAWIFTRSGSSWTQQGAKLTASDESGGGSFGRAVALSADGNIALIGAPNDANDGGAAWLFTRAGSTWTQDGAKLTGSGGGGWLGGAVALSTDGATALVGGYSIYSESAWVFAELPSISALSPPYGPPGGGGLVQITGTDFVGVDGVTFGAAPASFAVDSPTEITATAPAGSLGPIDVTVTNAQGVSPIVAADVFAYATPPDAPTSVVAVGGAGSATVSFATPAANGSPISSYMVTASPGGATAVGATSPITITGLGDWTSYTFTVAATNAAGTGPASMASTPVTTLARSQTALRDDVDPTYYGTPLTFNATVSSVPSAAATPTGTADFTVSGADPVPETLDTSGQASFSPPYYLNVGDTVTASYVGDANHDASTTTFTPTIEPAATAISLTSSANPVITDGDVVITASVTNESTSIVPFGSVNFQADGETINVPLDDAGQAGIEASGLPPGDYTIGATYQDDTADIPDFTPSTATLTQTVTVDAPLSSSNPTINGALVQGQTLAVTHGSWSNDPTSYSEQWEDCDPAGANCTKIPAATSPTYTLPGSDVGHTIRVIEAAANQGGAGAPATSAATGVIAAAAPTMIAPSDSTAPTISGTTTVGKTLMALIGTWAGTTPISYSYQWVSCATACTPITGATASSLTLDAAELGTKVAVRVTATNSAGSAQAVSTEVGPVVPAIPSASQVEASLTTVVRPTGPAAERSAILKAGGTPSPSLRPKPGS